MLLSPYRRGGGGRGGERLSLAEGPSGGFLAEERFLLGTGSTSPIPQVPAVSLEMGFVSHPLGAPIILAGATVTSGFSVHKSLLRVGTFQLLLVKTQPWYLASGDSFYDLFGVYCGPRRGPGIEPRVLSSSSQLAVFT